MTFNNDELTKRADQMFFDADNKIKEGRIADAKEILINLIKLYPEYGRAYNHLGWIYETKYKDYISAEECYRKALEFAPYYPPIYLNFAIVLSTTEKYEELEELLNRALKVPGINKDKIYNEFGIMYEIRGEYEKALEAYKKAIAYSLNQKDIDIFKQSIDRCNYKKTILQYN